MGMRLKRRAEEVVSLVDKVESEFIGKKDIEGIISIGTGGIAASKFLPEAIESFRKKNPNVYYQFYTNSAEFIKERLDQGLLDFGLVLEPIDISKYDYLRIKNKEKWGLLMRSDNILAQKKHILKEDLYKEVIVVTERLSLQKEIANWIGDDFSNLNILATYNIVTNIVILVNSGMASVLTIEGAVKDFIGDKLIFRPLYPERSEERRVGKEC